MKAPGTDAMLFCCLIGLIPKFFVRRSLINKLEDGISQKYQKPLVFVGAVSDVVQELSLSVRLRV
jgi:DNA repair photolyase